MILLLFLIPLQPSPWQPGEGLRLWSQAGSLSAGAEVGGSHRGVHTGQGHSGKGTPMVGTQSQVPRVAVELLGGLGCRDKPLQGPSIFCHRRWDTAGGKAAREVQRWRQAWRRCLKDL